MTDDKISEGKEKIMMANRNSRLPRRECLKSRNRKNTKGAAEQDKKRLTDDNNAVFQGTRKRHVESVGSKSWLQLGRLVNRTKPATLYEAVRMPSQINPNGEQLAAKERGTHKRSETAKPESTQLAQAAQWLGGRPRNPERRRPWRKALL